MAAAAPAAEAPAAASSRDLLERLAAATGPAAAATAALPSPAHLADEYGWTLLHWCALLNETECAAVLMQHFGPGGPNRRTTQARRIDSAVAEAEARYARGDWQRRHMLRWSLGS